MVARGPAPPGGDRRGKRDARNMPATARVRRPSHRACAPAHPDPATSYIRPGSTVAVQGPVTLDASPSPGQGGIVAPIAASGS